MKLNLKAATRVEAKIKAYLEENASSMLAEKINDGVRIQKDGKTLLNKKTLAGFMRFACDEAKKLAEKGAKSACAEDETVYDWAIRFFEEDGIEGTLFCEDGTEYRKRSIPAPKAAAAKREPPKPLPAPQMSLFELLENTENTQKQENVCEILHQEAKELCADPETGEILCEEEICAFDAEKEAEANENKIDPSAFDAEALALLDEMFGDELEVR